jgi:hypothetical protein
MRSVTESRRIVSGVVLLVSLAVPVAARQEAAGGAAPRPDEITAAIQTVQRDPNLAGERTMKMLRWRSPDEPRQSVNLGWLSWIVGFFAWLGQSTRYVIWAAAVVLAGWIAVYLTRAIRHRTGAAPRDEPFVAPTHVRDLDIRPESLPANIGRAARGLWDRGEHRAALSLLYRGLLSRLTHVHRVPIRNSSTEGDCLSLLEGRVPRDAGAYAGRLVHEWRGFVYGGATTAHATMHALCDDFGGALDRVNAESAEGGSQ